MKLKLILIGIGAVDVLLTLPACSYSESLKHRYYNGCFVLLDIQNISALLNRRGV